ncbi:hypothetical protein BAOM_3070 [Peribacillus asahii]|uniref:DUF5659 domain-containing protein n=1 Tax=Peribacillus asahii TaxID=228899 RepID=A0A3Q9RNL7_9BACI|nr:DUF5659 domain-containing protein [Peribacillus asahii]AZV43679.1 hypothetical protein BAOM_3070 [Peribacillus asahii]
MSKNFFFCYSKYVSTYLVNKGFKPITTAREMKENKVFTLYEITPDLQAALTEYKKNR